MRRNDKPTRHAKEPTVLQRLQTAATFQRNASPGRGMKRQLSLLVLALASFTAAAKDPASFRDTNQLVWDKTFAASLTAFFGRMHATYYWHGGLLSDQMVAGLGGPPDAVVRIGSSPLFLASACRAHSCMEKAAVIFKDPEHLIAFGVVHYPSCFDKPAKPGCSDHPSLSVLTRASPLDPEVRETLVDWAKGQVGELDKVEVRLIRSR
ncbi:hypothetical protein [Roseateles sp.]